MLPAFLISFREVTEASLIVATILSILVKLNQKKGIKTLWLASAAALLVSIFLLGLSSIFGVKIRELYYGKVEEFIEGILMIISAIFITWAVFFLHKYFAKHKVKLLQKVKKTVEQEEQKGLFVLVFTAVFREGFEIVLFLSTIYFSSDPTHILAGFVGGFFVALIVSLTLFSATSRMPFFLAFRTTSILLILFAGGSLLRGMHEFAKVGLLPEVIKVTFSFIPEKTTFMGSTLKAVFGLTQNMDIIQLTLYGIYVTFMSWWVFFRRIKEKKYFT